MRKMLKRCHVIIIALSCFILSSHSEVSAQDLTMAVPGQVAAAVYVQEWSQILWGLVTSQTGTQLPSFGDPVENPDGSISQSFTAADGTQFVLTFFMDGTARLDITLPNGVTQTVLQSAPVFDGVSVTTTEWNVTSSDGLSVAYTSEVDDLGTIFDISDDTTRLSGSAVLPGGISQIFDVLTGAGMTNVQATQSDGSTFTLSVPLAFPDFTIPDFSQEALGSYMGPGFTMNFSLISTPRNPFRWAAFLTELGEGITGTLSLNRDFSGYGQLEQNQTLLALISWSRTGGSQVFLLDGQELHMGPAGAALDFLLHRWQTLTGLFAPAPSISSFSRPLRKAYRIPRMRINLPKAPRVLRGTASRRILHSPNKLTLSQIGSARARRMR